MPFFRTIYANFNLISQQIEDLQIKSCETQNAVTKIENDLNADLSQRLRRAEQLCESNQAMIEKQMQMIEVLKEANYQKDKALDFLAKKSEYLAIQQRFNAKKMLGNPIRVVFLIEEPTLIKNLLTLIEELDGDNRFDVVLVNLWFKKYNKDGYEYCSGNLGSVIDVSRYTVYESYDPQKDAWLNLESINPDYVFFSRPYDFYREESYHIRQVSKYARTCYIPYGIQTVGGEIEKMVLTPECQHLYYFFLDNALRREFVNKTLGDTDFKQYGQAIYLGYPGIDMLLQNKQIKNTQKTHFNILWLPRWNTTEGNCHFFQYKDVLVDFANAQENCSVTLRPHPLCFNNFINTGEMTVEELGQLKEKYTAPHRIDETDGYLDSFSESSVLVADETSLIAEYFLTDKPIIFCKKQTHFSLLMEKLIEGCYVVENKEELKETLKALKNGEDSLMNIRKSLTKKYLTDLENSSSSYIKEELLADFNAKNLR